jgi:hypothetical protein
MEDKKSNYWDRYFALKDECINELIQILDKNYGSVNTKVDENDDPENALFVGYYDKKTGALMHTTVTRVYLRLLGDRRPLVCVQTEDNEKYTLEELYEQAFITIYEYVLGITTVPEYKTASEYLAHAMGLVKKYGRFWKPIRHYEPGPDDELIMTTQDGILYHDKSSSMLFFIETTGSILMAI